MSNYTIKAHPTRYAGTQFRSRHEATWAAFFDLLGWAWDYEPFDLNGWVPDFIIHGKYRDVLVEVKPTQEMALAAMPKAVMAAPDACIAVVADGVIDRHDEIAHICARHIGWISTPYWRARQADAAAPWLVSHHEPRDVYDTHIDGEPYLGFYTGLDTSSFEDGLYEGDSFSPHVALVGLWNEAANQTRWKSGDERRLVRPDRGLHVHGSIVTLTPNHPYIRKLDPSLSQERSGRWEVRWRDFSTTKQDVSFDTQDEAQVFAAKIWARETSVDLRDMGWDEFSTSDKFWRGLGS